MKRLFSFLFVLLGALCIFPLGNIYAQENLLFGQQHDYSIIFRGNGEAIVYAKLTFTNTQDSTLTKFSFEIPKAVPDEIAIYQIKLPLVCKSSYLYGNNGCREYEEPDYFGYYYDYRYRSNEDIQYMKARYTNSGEKYVVTLPNPVSEQKSSALIIAYTTKDYVKQNLGLYRYEFETIKVSSRIDSVRVAVDVDSQLYLKGKKSEVNYEENPRLDYFVSLNAGESFSSAKMDNIVNSIGSRGQVIKSAKGLSSEETFTVKGQYAKSWFRLNLGSIFVSIAIIAGIFVIINYLSKHMKKSSSQQKEENDKDKNGTSPGKSEKEPLNFFSLQHLGAGFISVVCTVGVSFLLMWVVSNDFVQSIMYSGGIIITVLCIIFVVVLYILAFFGPAVYLSVKHGWKSFLATLCMVLFWVFVFILMGTMVYQSPSNNGQNNRGVLWDSLVD